MNVQDQVFVYTVPTLGALQWEDLQGTACSSCLLMTLANTCIPFSENKPDMLRSWRNTGWPRKNATPTINNSKKTRDRMKELCALVHLKFFYEQDGTKILHFDEGVLILWPSF